MSAADVLDVAYTILAERADATDRALLSSLRDISGPSSREQLNRELGLIAASVTDPTGAAGVPVGEFSLSELASRLGVA